MYGPREFGPPAPTELKTVNKTEGRHGGNCWSVLLTRGDVTYDTKASKRVLSKQHNFSQSCVPERVLFSENHVINEKPQLSNHVRMFETPDLTLRASFHS